MQRIFDYMLLKHFLGLVWVFLIGGMHAFSQQYHFKQFGLNDGVPQSQIFDVYNDSRGFLWLGSRGGGIARYDGINFKNYQTGQGLINNFVNCVYEDSDNRIWIGTQAGISCFNGHKFVNYPISTTGEIRVFCFAESGGRLLIGTSEGLFRKEQDTILQIPLPHSSTSFYVHSILANDRNLFIGTNRGLYAIQPADFKVKKIYTEHDGLPDNYIQCIKGIDDTSAWLGTYGRGLRYMHGDKIEKPNFLLPDNLIVYDIEFDDRGNLWLATQKNGAYRVDLQNKSVQNFTERTGLSNDHVRCLTLDQWGSMWLGTSGGGLNQYTGQLFSHYTRKDGLADNYVYAVAQDKNGAIWVGNGNKGLSRIDSTGTTNFKDSIWENKKIKAMAQHPDSSWWFGTEGQGIFVMHHESVKHLSTKNGLCGNYVKDIEIGINGDIYVATLDGGISQIRVVDDKLIFVNFRYLTELPTNRILSLYIDGDNSCWFGTENKGVGYIKNGRAEMVVSELDIRYQAVRAMRMSGKRLWLATSSGLFSYHPLEKKVERKGASDLRSSNLYLLEFDLNGKLYVGHERGLDVLVLNESGEVIDVEFYGAAEGFPGIETCQNAAVRDRDGYLWFGTINGLARYNPNRLEAPTRPPAVWLEGIDLFYEEMVAGMYNYQPLDWDKMKGIPEFPHNKNHFGFSLSGIHLTHPGKVRFQWKLDGYDEMWVPVTNKRDVTYSNLPPGSYVFMYRALTEDGLTSVEKSWPFKIMAPFWQTTAFKVLVGAILISVLLLIFWWYLNRMKKRHQQLELEKEMLELEQKALRLQMNPHFLFNALNSIQSLVAQDNTKEARNYLQKFAKLMRLTLQNSRSERIKLSDEITTLENYLSLEQLTRNPTFSFNIEIQTDVDTDDVLIPPMMLQPFVENAIKHGVAHMGEKGDIKISFSLNNDLLNCVIRDNGMGREAALEKVKTKVKSHESAAIQVITDRLAILNREYGGNDLKISDVIEDGLVCGTQVAITLHVW